MERLSQIAKTNRQSQFNRTKEVQGLTEIVLVVPLEPDLQIMILRDHAEKFVEEMRALALSQAIDVLDVVTDRKDSFPASNRVGTNNWMLRGELSANIEW